LKSVGIKGALVLVMDMPPENPRSTKRGNRGDTFREIRTKKKKN